VALEQALALAPELAEGWRCGEKPAAERQGDLSITRARSRLSTRESYAREQFAARFV
jgi:hypothetical protein